MKYVHSIRCEREERGFTLLLAALVASLVLVLGISIFSIAQKSVTLSSIGRDSQFAFYAADTGAECALYWDVREGVFASSTRRTDLTCVGETIDSDTDPPGIAFIGYGAESANTFTLEPNGYCVKVSVEKRDLVAQPEGAHTIIRADGFSTRCADISTSPRAVQRSVELTY